MADKTIKLDIGTVYKKNADGCFYFRYQISGQRKAISLKTRNQKTAIAKARELLPIVQASTTEIVSAHVQRARSWVSQRQSLTLNNVWEVYSRHPERATPATVSEQNSYESTFREFVEFVGNPMACVNDITPEIVDTYAAEHLRSQNIAVDTHNRKIRRLKKVFEVLKQYRDGENPFAAKSLRRKEREEQEHIVRRTAFTREQEKKILEVLDDDRFKVMNKPEIRVIYHLGMFTGQRMKDCVLLRWDKVDLNRKRIWVEQFKTGKKVTIPIAPKLLEVLREAKDWQVDQYVCPNVARRYNKIDSKGKNTGNNLVNIDVLRVLRWAGLEPSIAMPGRKKKVNVLGFHSLRHSFASQSAESAIPKSVIVSILGASSDVVDKHYTHIGEEAQEKAIQSLFGETAPNTDRERIERALAIINASDGEPVEILKQVEKILRD